MPRTASCVFLSGVTLLAALLNAAQKQEVLSLASLLSGFAFGGFQGVVPAITSEIFGLQNFATNYAMIQLGPAAGRFSTFSWTTLRQILQLIIAVASHQQITDQDCQTRIAAVFLVIVSWTDKCNLMTS